MALEELVSNNNDSIDFNVTLQEILDLMIENKTKHFVLLNNSTFAHKT